MIIYVFKVGSFIPRQTLNCLLWVKYKDHIVNERKSA